MAAIDGILEIVVEQGGDELRLETDAVPVALAKERPLRLTLPSMSQNSLRTVMQEVVQRRAEGGPSGAFVYASRRAGEFQVELHGSLEDGGRARVKFARRSVDVVAHTEPGAERAFARTLPESSSGIAARDKGPASEQVERTLERTLEIPQYPVRATDSLPEGLSMLLRRALKAEASDVHVVEGEAPHFRVRGRLRADGEKRFSPATWLSAEQQERVRSGRALDLAWELDGTRLRANFYLCEQGVGVAVRVLHKTVPTPAQLSLPEQVTQLEDIPHGLVLVCGYVGAGKSTTLAALTHAALRRNPGLCLTLEQPIEYLLGAGCHGSVVRQREVGTHVPDFEAGLRDALREDPNLILIGEMRDPPTIALALTAVETGHLVMSSLHSRGTASAVDRIVGAFTGDEQRQVRTQLAEGLRAVVSQRLLPTADGTGRVPAVEVLRVNRAVAHMIREGKTEQIASALQAGRDAGMLPLEKHLAELVHRGIITRRVAEEATVQRDSLEQFLNR